MLIHKDCVDDVLLNQIKSIFQTVVNVKYIPLNTNENLMRKSDREVYKFDLELIHKNFNSAKLKTYVNFVDGWILC